MSSLQRINIPIFMPFLVSLLSIHSTILSAQQSVFVEALVLSQSPQYHHARSNSQLVPSATARYAGFWDGLSDLWEEVIEVSTYGPSERKLLKKQREQQNQQVQQQEGEQSAVEQEPSTANDEQSTSSYDLYENNDSEAWMKAFGVEKDKRTPREESNPPIDGYGLRDLLLAKWGAPLDIDFQRSPFQVDVLYCAILPVVGYGDRKGRGRALPARHESELDYLMHLQGVIEVLHEYDQLEGFLVMIETTNKVPKRGTESVLYQMKLSREELKRVLNL
ncbi:unnamed protein product [Cylindrotheca closterium]|uniref:Uncharacterized protein n=1 Tax=Cylindrotheca closterium TaxID=2856 RepID=A0AAD2FLD9_9STRA|nr:unnamed protein product [Cylindrotheca closterium]